MTMERKGRIGAKREVLERRRDPRRPRVRRLPPDGAQSRDDWVNLVMLILKHIDEGTLEGVGPALDSPLALRVWERDRRLYGTHVSAVLHALPARYAGGILNAIRKPKLRSEAMTIVDRLEKKAEAQGRVAAKREILERLLNRTYDLTDAERKRIRSQRDPKVLDAALEAFLSARSKRSVIEQLSRLRDPPSTIR
jgi:hypothetical protein